MTNDKLQRWALLAEIVGAAAIVITLIFLVLEIGDSTQATRSETAQHIFNQYLEANLSIANNPNIAEAWIKLNREGYASLNDIETSHATAAMLRFMMVYDNAYYQYRKEVLDEEIFGQFRNYTEQSVGFQFFEEFWERRGDRLTPAFQELVMSMMDDRQQ